MLFKKYLFLLCIIFSIPSCTGMLFQPDDYQYTNLEKNNVQFEDIYYTTTGNLKLHGWFLPSRQDYTLGTILFLHGNAQNISAHINSVFWLPYSGFNIFLFDYQGYGKSEGKPSLSGLQQDFHASLNWLMENPTIDNQKIIIFGQSLGAAIALHALTESKYKNSIRGIVAESSFTRYRTIVRNYLSSFWLTWPLQWPLSLTIADEFPPVDAIPNISPVPVLIIHSNADEIIPFAHGAALYQAAKEPKFFWQLDHFKHIEILSSEDNRKILVHHLKSMLNNAFPELISK